MHIPQVFVALPGLSALVLAVAPAMAQQGGDVVVSFPNTGRYLDASDGPREAEANQAELARHLQGLGRRWLAPGTRLQIEVQELDLAGHVQPATRLPQPLRVLDGAADWPRIDVRYLLIEPAGAVSRGEESLTDKAYLNHPLNANTDGPLRYEKRLLAQWFERRFGSRAGKR